MTQTDGALLTKPETRTQRPRQYGVVIYDHPKTPMPLVTDVLARVFNMEASVAQRHMMEIHEKGRTMIAPFTAEVAETKAAQVRDAVARARHTLDARHEPV